ncbi:MAG: rhamnulokinase [Anaerolineae bacterium]
MISDIRGPTFLAFDLGASSGRAMLGRLEDDRLTIEEIHRFANGGVRLNDGLHWDVLRLWGEVKQGIRLASLRAGDALRSLGLDTWGVDFGLLDAHDALVGNPYHYRDARTDGMMEAAFERVPQAEIYARTGVQFLQLNTLYQLLAMAQARSPQLEIAETLLTIPDLFNFWLTGRKVSEFTIATTTQCYDPRAEDWATELLEALDIPPRLFQEIVAPGTVLGTLRDEVTAETGAPALRVVAPGTHDTASAVAALPVTDDEDVIYISSGTWSLMGVEVGCPIINAESLEAGLTNEGGVGGTFRFLKNVTGLWLIQECRRVWAQQGDTYSYEELTAMAEAAPPFGPLIIPDDPMFLAPQKMPAAIRAFCARTGQRVPQSRGAVIRCALESLALAYRALAERLDALLGRHLATIHVIGGGAQNRLLNQLTADATGRDVLTGPVEATALGNVLVQAMALGYLDSLAAGRALVRRSFDVSGYAPRAARAQAWDAAYERYDTLRRRSKSGSTV